MGKVKAYTDIVQSKKLAEFLPIESADMCWQKIYDENHLLSDYRIELLPFRLYSGLGVPAWSLAALLGAVDFITINLFYIDERGYWVVSTTIHNSTKLCTKYESAIAFNPVDACYELIIKLHEQNLL